MVTRLYSELLQCMYLLLDEMAAVIDHFLGEVQQSLTLQLGLPNLSALSVDDLFLPIIRRTTTQFLHAIIVSNM